MRRILKFYLLNDLQQNRRLFYMSQLRAHSFIKHELFILVDT